MKKGASIRLFFFPISHYIKVHQKSKVTIKYLFYGFPKNISEMFYKNYA